MKPSALLVGLAAGLASALLFAGLVTQSASALGLSLAAPIPILLASLGWGSVSGFVAAVTSAVAISLFTGTFVSGLTLFASMSLASAVAGHLAGLARPIEEVATRAPRAANDSGGPKLDWYPLPRILMAITLLAVGGCLFLGWLLGFDPQEVAPAIEQALVAQGGATLDPAAREQIGNLSQIIVAAVPFAQPAFLVFTLVTTLYVAAAITRASGRLMRPKDDIPATSRLPRIALPIFAAGLAVSFLGGPLGTVGALFAGAFGASFIVVGLAAFHFRTRGRAGRGLILFTTYAAILLLSFPLLAFLAYGLVDTARQRPINAKTS